MARLLVVDDERDILDLLARRLREDGHEVLSADSADTALALVRAHGLPDAVVLDVDLPGLDGFQLLSLLRQDGPGLRAVFITALWIEDVLGRIEEFAARYVAKPFTGAGLKAVVREALAA
ncbi:response regulator [Actinoplanes friuliensis]|uniref:response regulator n=1 Tax=Actinoplanes friuliensis TaxID=196914 RepID=UPI0005A1993C|nr:response regulator [Actinoplanes friuliensis]